MRGVQPRGSCSSPGWRWPALLSVSDTSSIHLKVLSKYCIELCWFSSSGDCETALTHIWGPFALTYLCYDTNVVEAPPECENQLVENNWQFRQRLLTFLICNRNLGAVHTSLVNFATMKLSSQFYCSVHMQLSPGWGFQPIRVLAVACEYDNHEYFHCLR